MLGVSDLRKGTTFEIDGALWKVLEFQHHKPGRGNAYIRTKLRNLRTGGSIERTFLSGERVQDVRLDRRQVQYLYHDDQFYTFMDVENYEQSSLSKDTLGEAVYYLIENGTLELSSYDGEPIDVELPITVDLKVAGTEPGFKGDTATGGTKPANLETGLKIQVPLFVNTGDTVRVDTRTGTYLTRV
jgi:elongation factor P